MKKEIWKDIPGYEGRYLVSNYGNVKSTNFLGHSGEKQLRITQHHTGYMVVSLGKYPKKTFLVHRLVAEAFITNTDKKRCVNHIDGNKTNNCVENLEWVTSKENVQHAIINGLKDPHNVAKLYGAEHYSSKPVYQFDKNGNFIKKWECRSDVGRAYNKSKKPMRVPVDEPGRTLYGYVWLSSNDKFDYWKHKPHKKQKNKKQIEQFDQNGTLIKTWKNIDEITKNTSFSRNGILGCCNHDRKTHGNYIWKYKPSL